MTFEFLFDYSIALPSLLLVAAAMIHAQPGDEGSEENGDGEWEEASPGAVERKKRSEEILRAEGVPVNPHLPCIEDENEARIPSREEVARRAIALCMVATRAAGAEPDEAWELVEGFGIASDLTGAEREFILDSNASEHDSIQFSWRGECFWVMLWALGYIDTMGRPDRMCDSERAVEILSDRTTAQFIADGWMRSPSEILDAADLIYRYHWAVRNAALNGEEVPAGLDPDVVMERHHALNWLIDSMGEPWDDISTDT